MRRLLLVLALVLGLVPVLSGRALACSCAPQPPAEYARGADVVFTGRATAINNTVTVTTTVFAVDTVYKGSAERYRIIETPAQGGACGYGFAEGHLYTVFAFLDHSGRWQTSSCSGNLSHGIVAAKYKLSATPLLKESPSPLPLAAAGGHSWLWLVVAIGAAMLFGFGFVAGRQRRWTLHSG